jgi:hypothetical protein
VSHSQYRPEDFLSALAVAPDDKARPVLVGGQAVNFWAQLYADKLPELKPWQPFLSKDCDVYGNYKVAQRIQEKSGWKLNLFPPRELAVAVLVANDGRTMEVLNAVRGLTPQDFERMCVRVQVGEWFLWILNPVALLKAKLANVAELDQTERQDRRHVSILIPVVREFLSQALSEARAGEDSERDVVTLMEAALLVASSADANSWIEALGAKYERLFPLAQLETTSLKKARNFVVKRLPRAMRKSRK